MIARLYKYAQYMLDTYRYKREYRRRWLLSYPPRSLTITISGACEYKCIFCVNHSIDAKKHQSAKKLYKIPFTMSVEHFCKILDWAYEGNIPHFHICAAGEPFLHKNVFEFIDKVIDRYGHVSFQTDFTKTIFDDGKVLDKILDRKDHISYITTDIFSANAEVHNRIKKGSDLNKLIEYMEYLSSRSSIVFDVHHILTKETYKDLYMIPKILYEKGIKFRIATVNLHPYGFNDFTDIQNVFMSGDGLIWESIREFSRYCEEKKIKYSIPKPFDSKSSGCGVFWSRIQLIPIKTLPKDKWIGNAIPGYCNAVVNGKMETIGNIFDYKGVMDFWNNPILVEIRRNLVEGKYPDSACVNCQNYTDE